MKAKEFREKTEEELLMLLQEKRAELTELRFKVSARQYKNYRRVREVKREIARILTILKNKQNK